MTLNPLRWRFVRRIRIRRLQRELVNLQADVTLLNRVDTGQLDYDAIIETNRQIERKKRQIRELRT